MGRHRETETKMINGYMAIYKPEHPNSFKSEGNKGYVYEHVLVVSLMLGRPLNSDEFEQVHHLNFNRLDNRPKNLIVLTKGMHTKLHNWIDRCNLEEYIRQNASDGHHVYKCENCGKYYLEDKKYCNADCRKEHRINQIPVSKEELVVLLDNMDKVQIANKFNTDRNSVYSWLRDYSMM